MDSYNLTTWTVWYTLKKIGTKIHFFIEKKAYNHCFAHNLSKFCLK